MPLGDSISAEGTCWRRDLWNQLADAGFDNIDFVGTQTAGDCGGNYDSDNEGHGGVLVTQVTAMERDGWFSTAQPDVVLMHFGTNDVWNNVAAESILDAYGSLVESARAENPQVIVLLAQLIPMAASACSACQQSIPTLNGLMPAWAEENSLPASPIFVVDQFTGFDADSDTTDGVHPYTDSGAEKMASKWFAAISALYP